MSDELLRPGDCARLARVSPTHVRRMCDRGLLKCFRLPGTGHRRVRVADLRAWLVSEGAPTDLVDAAFPVAGGGGSPGAGQDTARTRRAGREPDANGPEPEGADGGRPARQRTREGCDVTVTALSSPRAARMLVGVMAWGFNGDGNRVSGPAAVNRTRDLKTGERVSLVATTDRGSAVVRTADGRLWAVAQGFVGEAA